MDLEEIILEIVDNVEIELDVDKEVFDNFVDAFLLDFLKNKELYRVGKVTGIYC